ncbi:MAG: protein phosphatase 2C domain-containing protein [Corynebacterium sp.]|nr:protein phosphatase 2C domain-containing protein [Corynebacterium sp.]
MLKLNYAVASDRGLVRGNNEDSAYAGPHLLALADGMGGHAAGEIASQLMIQHVKQLDVHPGENDMLAILASVADDGNRAIAERVRQAPETDGMGTTLTALMFDGYRFGLCHVGDSRGYRLRHGVLEQITTDDTFVQTLVAEGKLDPEDVSTHPQRSLILKAYNGRPVEPTVTILDAQIGDRLLLCSDGLSDPVTHATIEETLQQGTPANAAQRLVELALRSGGPDNVTVVVADIVPGDNANSAYVSTVPVTAGALNSGEPESPRPDTAAGRAATMRSGVALATPPAEEPQPKPVVDTAVAKPKKSRKLALWVSLALLVGLAVGGWLGYNHIRNTFYIAEDDGTLVIERGLSQDVFGYSLHSHFQRTCINDTGALSLVDANSQGDSNCRAFKLTDLPESRREIATLPAGSYNSVLNQMLRLSEDALPVCASSTGQNGASGTQPTEQKKPGVNCREAS